jgi:hypothetical protein
MLIKRARPSSGKFFALWPRRTPDGWAVFEWLNWEVTSWGWGSGNAYHYWRDPAPIAEYSTPPGDPKVFCKNYQSDGPTPCWYPKCRVVDSSGTEACSPPVEDVPGYSLDPVDGSHYRREPRSNRDMGTRMMGCGDSDR